jgi:hypothetical protein
MRAHWRRWRAVYSLLVLLALLLVTRDYWGDGRLARLFVEPPRPVTNLEDLAPPVRYVRPAAAPDGSPWPTHSGYLVKSPRLAVGGMAQVTADNRGNPTDVFVKLVRLGDGAPRVVRQILVRGGEQFAMNKVQPGSYEIWYLMLDTGALLRTQRFDVTVKKTADGEQYLGWTVGLYGTPTGTEHHAPISEREFAGDEPDRG